VGENICHLFTVVMLHQGQATARAEKERGGKTLWLPTGD
jgi:hypothetical protein